MEGLINYLPEGCLYEVMRRTSPDGVHNFSLTSTSFRSMADSDFLWKSFLPLDYADILSRTVDPVVFTTKKDLFFQLSNRHVLIDGGKMSFGLDRSNGAKCYILSTSMLAIDFADAPHFYWRRISLDDSRFAEVAEPMFHCQSGICGKIDCKALSPKIKYAAYLVYKLTEILYHQYYRHPFGHIRHCTLVTVGKNITKNTVYLKPDYGKYVSKIFNEWKTAYENPEFDNMGTISAKERADGWIEVELGEFYIEKDEDGEVQIKLEEDDPPRLIKKWNSNTRNRYPTELLKILYL